jgi:hypothetical protein
VGFRRDNSHLRDSATSACQNEAGLCSYIKKIINQLIGISSSGVSRKSSKKSSSRIGEKKKLGEGCELFYVNERKILGLFRSFPGFA